MKDFKSPSLFPLLFCFLSLCEKPSCCCSARCCRRKSSTTQKHLRRIKWSKRGNKQRSQPSPGEPQTVKDPLNNDNSCHCLATNPTLTNLCLSLHYCSTAAFSSVLLSSSSFGRNVVLFLQHVTKSSKFYCSRTRNQSKVLETPWLTWTLFIWTLPLD